MMHLSTQALFALLAVSLTYTFLLKDRRYPSDILTANIRCNATGSFRHPTNCSWFYKCESKTVKGYYQKQFFECAPGTVFDDALDICIPKSAGGHACGHEPVPGSPVCQPKSLRLEANCYPNLNDTCVGTKTSGMCHYRVACTEEGKIFYCDGDMLNAGLQCIHNYSALCKHFGKQPLRLLRISHPSR